jgi:adenylate kinase
MLGLLEERFAQPDTRNGFILDGYPRNLAQAAALDELLERIGQPMDVAVQLDVGNDLLVERLAGRAKLEGRADDTPESVRNRLKLYDDVTAPVIEHYRKQGKLAHLDGVGTLDAVFTRILEAINPTSDVG